MSFQIHQSCASTKARLGTLSTPHGDIQTPIFMPVGTAGTVKSVLGDDLVNRVKAQIILGNTYHLYLRPGTEVLKEAGGLHKFMAWDRPILTDSGGYQVFSLSDNRKLTEEGALFQSHIDGSRHLFTSESVMEIQRAIGGDIIMAFDECPPYPSTYDYAKQSMELTHRWLERCVKNHKENEPLYGYSQMLFPIVQGSTFSDLRAASAEFCASMYMPGHGIGGLSVGEPAEEMYAMTELVCDILPKEKPRYLMGVGTPANLLECIALGVDMFDCVMPTRNARTGYLFTSEGIINIKNKKWRTCFEPIDANLPDLDTDQVHTRAYLAHLFQADEIIALTLASLHNLRFYLHLMQQVREHIAAGTFLAFKNEAVPRLAQRI
jgi:queuine tRNA-ribosyltransferase